VRDGQALTDENTRLAGVIEQIRALPAITLYRPILGTPPGSTKDVIDRDALLALLPPAVDSGEPQPSEQPE
jgi:hypothetical protein